MQATAATVLVAALEAIRGALQGCMLCKPLQPKQEAAVADAHQEIMCRPRPSKHGWPHLLYNLTSVLRLCLPVEEWLQTLPCRGRRSNRCQLVTGALHSGCNIALT